jgi:two-component system phosphate regulon sensor histidine kinase PhoR
MTNPWLAEVLILAGLLLAAVIAGGAFGHTLWLLWGVTALYLGFHLYRLWRVEQWLEAGAGPPPSGNWGLWGEVHYQLHRLRQNHRRRKRTLTQYLQRFREFTSAMPDATVVLRSGNGEIEWFNSAAGRLLGLRAPQDVGQRIMNLVRHPIFTQYFHAARFGDPIEFPSPVDEMLMLAVSIVPYGREQLLLVARDNTRLHRLEEVRRNFVANVSHELRTPLTVISGFLEALCDDAQIDPEERRRALHLMSQQTTRMQHIVEDLLLLARLEADRRPVRRERVAVAEMLRNLLEEARTLSGRRHDIELEAETDLELHGNGEELRSAFTNLVSNAVRYTPSGGRIVMRWFSDARGAHFQVQDTGVGIADHDLPRLTERFYRVDTGRSRQTGGTGLGLAIVKHVLERHDAALSITSRLGVGSTFSCDFPLSSVLRKVEMARVGRS